MELSRYDLIERVLVSKKSQKLLKLQGKVCLRVNKAATKPMIKKAVEAIWKDAKVEKVAIITVPGRSKKVLGRKVRSKSYKKSIVSLRQTAGMQGALSVLQGQVS